MGFMDFLKYFFVGKSKTEAPRVASTSVESIEFPPTYKDVNLYNTIPAVTEGAPTGSVFGQSVINLIGNARDEAVYQQCLLGNLPDWMRTFKAITVNEKNNTLIYFVSPDVLCIGSNDDFLRVSVDAYHARRIVDLFGCMLPTSKISDQVWQASNLKMMPTGMGASFQMASTKTLIDHNALIEKQRADRNFNIIAGHKKDIIFHSALLKPAYKANICIYGFHYPSGKPIQDAQYEAHNALYQDYSHSIRLISRKAILNNQMVDMMDILNDKQYSYLISKESAYNADPIYKK